MASVNKVILLGNLGADPELRFTSGGQAVCDMRIATTSRYKGKDGGQQEDTQWHRIVVWGKQAETAKEYLQKGSPVYIEGRIQTRSYDDKDGNKRWITEIVGQRMQFLGRAPENSNSSQPAPPPETEAPPLSGEDDDLPF